MAKRQIPIDDEGRIVIPPDLVKKFGIKPGGQIFIEEGQDRLLLHRPVSQAARIYVEPTSRCNLECSTCIRNVWEEKQGNMDARVFDEILTFLDLCGTPPEIFFGGFGEPLSHPSITDMIGEAKKRGARVELISNGILLNSPMADQLVALELDRLWISIDGASSESYEDVRLGDQLPLIKNNLKYLKELRRRSSSGAPAIGITFVAMKKNIGELKKVHEMMYELGADTLHISNVLPHTEEMKGQILYEKAMDRWTNREDRVLLPRMDIDSISFREIAPFLSQYEMHGLVENDFSGPQNSCPFIEKGSLSIRWDGSVSPCLPLVHSSDSFFKGSIRHNRSHYFGSLEEESLGEIWNKEEYRDFRKRVMEFDFSPCHSCTGCEMSRSNDEDCFGSLPVSCGGCLWAQGFIQCP